MAADALDLGEAPAPAKPGFAFRVGEFEGPLDLLLSLIAKHELELTAVALHEVTDDFIAYIRAQGDDWDLSEATEFLVVAATLLDLKASRLLPGEEIEDEEDLALLEARDFLFSRLLQYRAYKQISAHFEQLLHGRQQWLPRTAGLDPDLQGLLPEVVLTISPQDLALLAVHAMTPQEPPTVSVAHIHAAAVSVREQASLLAAALQRRGGASFRQLIADCPDRMHVVARFLAVLELFRDGRVTFEQAAPMADLYVRWSGSPDSGLGADFDEFDQLVAP